MRVIQVIDSLRLGGAERMAVNIANALSTKIDKSYLCATREEGPLKETLFDCVGFYFLNRKRTIDIKAIRALTSFIRANRIDVIHAHASSFFIGTMVKLYLPYVKLIWHDHLGKRVEESLKPWAPLKICSNFFNHVICVNSELLQWAKLHLNSKNYSYIPNFPVVSSFKSKITLNGTKGKRILYLANLRTPKNHMLLLRAFSSVVKDYSDWTIHFVGSDYGDAYANEIKSYISLNNLDSHVFILGSQKAVSDIIDECSIGVISSTSEGLPMALLEYGLGGLAVITADVGQCRDVVLDAGIVVESNSLEDLRQALIYYMANENSRRNFGNLFQNHVLKNFNPDIIVEKLTEIY